MAKYIVLSLIWSEKGQKYIHPGEEYECSDEAATVLLEKNVIKPATYKRQVKNKELKDGTNDK